MRRRRGYTRLSSKNQVTLPVAVLARLGLKPGDELRVDEVDGRVVLEPVEPVAERRLAALRHIGGRYAGLYPERYLEELRDEWRS